MKWLELLNEKIQDLPTLLEQSDWSSIVVDKKEPHTYRVFKIIDGIRICLHRFEPCSLDQAFPHAHRWPGAFRVLQGQYLMKLGIAPDQESDPEFITTMILNQGSSYTMDNPLLWHVVQPLIECFSVAINGTNYQERHVKAPTTDNKGLREMTSEELNNHLKQFQRLLQ